MASRTSLASSAPTPKRKRAVIRSWRMALRFLLRSLDLRASCFSLALLAVTVGASVATTGFNLKADLKNKMTRELRQYGANLMVTPPLERSPSAKPATLDQAWLPSLRSLAPGGARAWASPMLFVSGEAAEENALLIGVDLQAARELATTWRLDGSWPEPGGSPACLVGSTLAARLDLTPGDTLPVALPGAEPETLTVAAIISTAITLPMGMFTKWAGLMVPVKQIKAQRRPLVFQISTRSGEPAAIIRPIPFSPKAGGIKT